MSTSDDSLGNSCDNPTRSGGDNPPFRQDTGDTHDSTVSQDNNTTTNGVAPGNSRTRPANLRDEANGDDNSGFATSDFPPLPTHSNYPLFAEVRRLKEALQTENRKVAALEEELAAIKRWLGQAPAEVVALLPSEATKNQAVAADGATSDAAGGSADTGGRAGSASHERFRQRTGNPRSSFFTNSRVDLNYNYRTNHGQDTGGNRRDGSDIAATCLRRVGAGGAQGRLDLPGEQDDRSGGEHGSGLVATIGYSVSSRRDGRGRRGRGGRGRGTSSSETGRPRYVLNPADYGNPFPGPNTAAGGGWDSYEDKEGLGDW
ncbi:hypothetical protein DIS24_g8381 [Lasiodiplodia hormozganensis]|uniref:Uncharacterized protein n=1 Tax=Lasiodiplodia hormozganensis TaxID=869390 RepID=A0AA40CMZ2_9PEZI|nr:hypothetical protein DIS24_g8381 [Lasiodiplodia hormozganensis]